MGPSRSIDGGRSWEPMRIIMDMGRNLTAMLKRPEWCLLLQGPGRGICMQDGTLVFPAQFQLSPEERRSPHSCEGSRAQLCFQRVPLAEISW